MKTQKRFYRSESTMDLAKYWDHGEHFAMQNRSADFGIGLVKLWRKCSLLEQVKWVWDRLSEIEV